MKHVKIQMTKNSRILFYSILILCLLVIMAIQIPFVMNSAAQSVSHHIQLEVSSDPPSPPICPTHQKRRPILHLGIMSMATPNKTMRRQYLRSMFKIMMEQPILLTTSQQKTLFGRSALSNHQVSLNGIGRGQQHHEPLLVKDFVRVQFIVGRPSSSEEYARLLFEHKYYDDMIVLDTAENMNEGKTYEYFDYVAHVMNSSQRPSICSTMGKTSAHYNMTGYEFVAKGDDDAFIHLPNLVAYLLDIRAQMDRQELSPMVYLGRQWSGFPGSPPAMAGMLYMLSWDLVQWVASSLIPLMNAKGDEDQQVSRWFHMDGTLNLSSVSNEHQWVDHPKSGEAWASSRYTKDLICIHQSKKDEFLLDAMNHYFPA